MINFYNHISTNSSVYKNLTCGDNLFTMFNCGVKNKYQDIWSHHHYIVYVAKGRKVWHTSGGLYDLSEGSLVFVRKGACIIEQFFDTEFCLLLFFITDDFIKDVLKNKLLNLNSSTAEINYLPILELQNNQFVEAFFQSMMVYFNDVTESNADLLQLKFRELMLILTNNPQNKVLLNYLSSIQRTEQKEPLQTIMEDNFCFNLKLEDFAKLSCRSLSTFKRDFEKIYQMPPSKWLLEKRLNYAKRLIEHLHKPVNVAAFESGFESPSHFSRAFRTYFGHPPSVKTTKMAG